MVRQPDLSIPTKSTILSAASRLFAQKGFAETSMREIAESAGVSKAAIYHYFRDKDGLYLKLVDEAIGRLTVATREIRGVEPARAAFARALVLHLEFARSHPELVRMLLHEELCAEHRRGRLASAITRHRETEVAVFRDLLERGVARGEFKSVHLDLSAHALAAVVHILSAGSLSVDPPVTVGEIAQNALDVLLNGLATSALDAGQIAGLLARAGAPAVTAGPRPPAAVPDAMKETNA